MKVVICTRKSTRIHSFHPHPTFLLNKNEQTFHFGKGSYARSSSWPIGRPEYRAPSRKNWQIFGHEKKVAPGGNRNRNLLFIGSFRLIEVWLG